MGQDATRRTERPPSEGDQGPWSLAIRHALLVRIRDRKRRVGSTLSVDAIVRLLDADRA
jgi:hypothetical protein